MQKRDRESQQGEQPEQEEAAEAAEEKSPASDSPPEKKTNAAAPSAVGASDALPSAPPAAKASTAAPSAAGVLLSAPPAAELPKEVWFKYGETEDSSVQIAVGSSGSSLKNAICGLLHKAVTEIAVSVPESLANDPDKLQRFCLEGSAELNSRATLDSEFFRELGQQALVVTERIPSSVAVKVRFDHTVATIKELRLGFSTVGDLKAQAVRDLFGPNERAADYSLFFDPTQPTIIWGSAGSADWLDKFCEGIPAASADPDAAEKSPRKLKGDMTLDQDFFRVVKGNVEITLVVTERPPEGPLSQLSPHVVPFPAATILDAMQHFEPPQGSYLLLRGPDRRVNPNLFIRDSGMPFVGRKEAVIKALKAMDQRIGTAPDPREINHAIIFFGAPGSGKCLAPETPVLLADGHVSRAGQVRVGDLLVGDDGTARVVLSTTAGTGQLFRVLEDGTSLTLEHGFVCNDQHLLVGLENSCDAPITIKCADLFSALGDGDTHSFHAFRRPVDRFPLEFDLQAMIEAQLREHHAEFSVQATDLARFFGHALGGQATEERPAPCSVIEFIRNAATGWGIDVQEDSPSDACWFCFSGETGSRRASKASIVFRIAEELGITNRVISPQLLGAPMSVRMHLLAGIIESCGLFDSENGCFEVDLQSEELACQLSTLARSVGLCARISTRTGSGLQLFCVAVFGQLLCKLPLLQSSPISQLDQQKRVTRGQKDELSYSIQIKKLGAGQYAGFTLGMFVSPEAFAEFLAAKGAASCQPEVEDVLVAMLNGRSILTADEQGCAAADGRYPGRFLLGDFTVTHNTRMLDELRAPKLSTEDTNSHELQRICEYASRWVTVGVTWNGFTTKFDEPFDLPPGAGLAVRMLYEHWFVDRDRLPFVNFCRLLGEERIKALQPSEVARAILDDTGSDTLLLLVDEILMSRQIGSSENEITKQVLSLIHEARSLLDSFPAVRGSKAVFCAFSCLNREFIAKLSTTSSSRKIVNPSLRLLDFSDSQKALEAGFQIVHDEIRKLDIRDADRQNQLETALTTIRQAVADAGGHPASLRGILKWLRDSPRSAIENLRRGKYDVVEITSRIRTRSIAPPEVVQLVVLAQKIDETSEAENPTESGKRIFAYEQAGLIYLLDSVPSVTSFALLGFVAEKKRQGFHFKEFAPRSDPELSSDLGDLGCSLLSDEELAAQCLWEMLNPDQIWGLGEQLEAYITFHPILRAIYDSPPEGKWVPLCNLFGTASISPQKRSVLVFVPHRLDFFAWAGNFSTLVQFCKEHGFALPRNVIVRCSKNNPGFETAVVMRAREDATSTHEFDILVAIEARDSKEGSKATISASVARGKAKSAFLQAVDLGMPMALIIIALRNVTASLQIETQISAAKEKAKETAKETAETPVSVFIIKRDGYLRHIGPALSARLSAKLFEKKDSEAAAAVAPGSSV